MELEQRRACYKAIEDYRKRPLIVYATSTRFKVKASMAGDAVREFTDQIDAVPKGDRIDVLIHSTGGDALTAWKLISVLRERFNHITVLVPFMAFSAATIFALGGNEIVMHPYASLGPIDPQIVVALPDGSQRHFSYEDVGSFLRFLIDDVKVTEQVHTSAIIEKLFAVADPLLIGTAKRASDLSTDVGERMLLTHMKDVESKTEVRQIVEDLNKGFFAHGDAVSRSRAIDLRLKIADRDEKLEQLMWNAYLALEDYMKLRHPFHPIEIYMSDKNAAASLEPPPPLNFPPNAPPKLIEQIWAAWAQNALQQKGVEVDYSLINALVESIRKASEFRTLGKLFVWRGKGGQVQLSLTETEARWRSV